MNLNDGYGNTITTASDAARDRYDQGVRLLLEANYGASAAFEASVAADPGFALCHAMAGEGARLASIAETAKGFAGDLVRPVACAWGAIARGNWTAALENLAQVMATTERLGDSRAQRDLVELAYVNVLIKLGLAEEARRTLLFRRPVLAKSPPVAGFH